MPKGKTHDAKKKAAAVSEVAARHGLNKSVVSRWKTKIPAGELQRVATKKGALDSAGRIVLAQTEPRRAGLLKYDEAIDHSDFGHLFGETIDVSSATFYTRM